MAIEMKNCITCGWDFPVVMRGDTNSGGRILRTINVGDNEVDVWECDGCAENKRQW